jgi:thiosulfate dehydrogenase (quinone) large subunit
VFGPFEDEDMFVSFLESIKHVGHLYPIAVLRIYLGYIYFSTAFDRVERGFLEQPRLAAAIMDQLPQKDLAFWYKEVLETLVVPNWQIFAYTLVYLEYLVGVSFLLGFLVRPVALIGIFLAANSALIVSASLAPLQKCYLALFIVLFWVGAGRCLGFDYYFYKRQRGLWW